MTDFPRNVVPINNVHKIDGIFLETVREIAPGYSPGYAIVVRDFETMLLGKREGMDSIEIYKLAQRLAKDKGIILPD